jgi:isopenicillin-N N-acyltransferase-like protein
VCTLSGTPYDIGYQHGRCFKHQIRALLSSDLARINLLRHTPLPLEEALKFVSECQSYIETDVPELATELSGLADGACISYPEAILLQLRRELIAYTHEADGDCTSVGLFTDNGKTIIAQNIDLAGGLRDYSVVFRIIPENPSAPRICMYTFMGLCGYVGLNSAGLAVAMNMIFADKWRAGVPIYLLVRHLLAQTSLETLLVEVERIRRASSRHLLVTDGQSILGMEMTVDDMSFLRHAPQVHANHLLCEGLRTQERLQNAPLEISRRRQERVERLLAEGVPVYTVLSNHDGFPNSVCKHSLGELRRSDTVGSVIMIPAECELHALRGHPCEERHVCVRL